MRLTREEFCECLLFVLSTEWFQTCAHLPRDTGHVLEVVSNLFCCAAEVSHGVNKDRQMDSRLSEEHNAATLVMFKSKMAMNKKMEHDGLRQ